MQNSSNLHAGASLTASRLDCVSHLRTDWRLAPPPELQLMGMLPVNLLIVGMDSMIPNMLDLLLPGLKEPLAVRWPGERLMLPPVARGGTMILHDVGALEHEDQHRLLDWSRQAAGRTRLVSTTAVPLFPRVKDGTFLEALYYELNTVFVDLTE